MSGKTRSEKIHSYSGEAVEVTYDLGRCIHAAECVRGLPAVFDPDARPWIHPDRAAAAEVVAVIRRCPTGALQARAPEVDTAGEQRRENVVAICADGPLYARGNLRLVDAGGDTLLRDTRIALCRCGASARKPFCDNSHRDSGFHDPGTVADPQIKAGDGEAGGELEITVTAKGPLVLSGPVRVVDGREQEACRGTTTALCRCGASANKPFCDGSHGRVGFTG